jgi:tRNA G26 N,N-dimethylase Trm1
MAEGSTQIAAESSSDTKSVTEGAATLLVTDQLAAQPGATAGFYNPRMRLNRELCLAEIDAALAPGPWRPRSRVSASGSSMANGDGATDTGGGGGEGLGAEGHPVRLLDAFTASGALALRVALEVGPRHPGRRVEVSAADLEPRCCALAVRNAARNGLRAERLQASLHGDTPVSPLPGAGAAGAADATPQAAVDGGGDADADGGGVAPLRVVCADARALLWLSAPFEYCHLDPFGSYAAPRLRRRPLPASLHPCTSLHLCAGVRRTSTRSPRARRTVGCSASPPPTPPPCTRTTRRRRGSTGPAQTSAPSS